VNYATTKGIPARWYYINISAPIIVNNLKALIVSDILGQANAYEVNNTHDSTVLRALAEIHAGNAKPPIADKRKKVKARRIPSLLMRTSQDDSEEVVSDSSAYYNDEEGIETSGQEE
jgi:type III secretion system FlhB-like substrate exporter